MAWGARWAGRPAHAIAHVTRIPKHQHVHKPRELADAGLDLADLNDEVNEGADEDDASSEGEIDVEGEIEEVSGAEEDAEAETGKLDRHGLPVELRMDDYDEGEEGEGEVSCGVCMYGCV